MKVNSYLPFALLVLLVSYTLAVQSLEHETATQEAKGDVVDKVDAYGGGGGNWGGGGGHGGGGGGGCRHGCCYGGHGGYCQRCCASPEEAKAVTEQAKGAADVHNVDAYGGGGGNWGGGGGHGGGGGNWGGGGGGGGGGCRHGCCYGGHGGCQRCCASPEEAKAVSQQGKGAPDVDKEAYGGGGGNWGGGGGGGNWGGGGGGGCRLGCCGRRGYGGCQRCCASLEEAKALTENKLNP